MRKGFLFCALSQVCHCFTVHPNLHLAWAVNANYHPTKRRLGQNGNDITESKSISGIEDDSPASSWVNKLDQGVLSAMKQELVDKYLEQGLDPRSAEHQVEEFFRDREQAEKYIEMRMYTAAVADDVGPSTVLQLVGGFLVGFLAIAGQKLLQSWPSGN